MKALILVDLQNDFMPGGPLAVPDGNAVVPVALRLIPEFEFVVATQDFHPANHGSFASTHPGVSIGDSFELNGLNQIAWPEHCIQGTHGAQLVDELSDQKIDQIVQKGTDVEIDSYSGFFDNGRRKATELSELLKSQRVTQVDIMGLATDYCVKFTALDAADLGFKTRLILEGCRGVELNGGDTEKAIKDMKAAGVEIVV